MSLPNCCHDNLTTYPWRVSSSSRAKISLALLVVYPKISFCANFITSCRIAQVKEFGFPYGERMLCISPIYRFSFSSMVVWMIGTNNLDENGVRETTCLSSPATSARLLLSSLGAGSCLIPWCVSLSNPSSCYNTPGWKTNLPNFQGIVVPLDCFMKIPHKLASSIMCMQKIFLSSNK